MRYVIGNAWHDENGHATGGQPGDQLQVNIADWKGEVRFTAFYVSQKGWLILRPKTAKLAKKLAKLMSKACNNVNIGYSQSDRYGIINAGIKTKKPVNCDCSSLVRECVQEAAKIDVPDFYTANEVVVLKNTGLFEEPIEYKDHTTLYIGDILVTKIKGHTAIVTEGESRTNPYEEPKLPITSKIVIAENHLDPVKYLTKGEGVKWLQYELCRVGYQFEIDAFGGIDGICGNGTVDCIMEFQQKNGLEVDGICGKKTRKKLKKI